MACAVSTLMAMPRDVTCGEIGAVANMAAANSRLTIDPVFIAFLLMCSTGKDGCCRMWISNPPRARQAYTKALERVHFLRDQHSERGKQDQGTSRSLRLDRWAIPRDSRPGRLQGTLTETLRIALAELRQCDDALSQGRTDGVVAARGGARSQTSPISKAMPI